MPLNTNFINDANYLDTYQHSLSYAVKEATEHNALF